MAKLYFRYGAMNSGKSTALLQVAHNYEERGHRVLVAKPAVDAKGGGRIESRLGVGREAEFLIQPGEDVLAGFRARSAGAGEGAGEGAAAPYSAVLIDEAQFLSADQVDGLLRVALGEDIPVIAYGIRTDFRTRAFPGSRRLLEIAHSIEELKTICRCGRKAIFNARLRAGSAVFEGEQVAIDGLDAQYESLCGSCYLRASGGRLG